MTKDAVHNQTEFVMPPPQDATTVVVLPKTDLPRPALRSRSQPKHYCCLSKSCWGRLRRLARRPLLTIRAVRACTWGGNNAVG